MSADAPGATCRRTWVEALTLVMRLEEGGWAVAGLDYLVLQPEWPPSRVQLGSPKD